MRIGRKEYSESEINAYVKELKDMLGKAVKEMEKLGYEDCFSCVHKGACAFADDCRYRWEFADKAERLINE